MSYSYSKAKKPNREQTAILRKNGWIYNPSKVCWNRDGIGLIFRESKFGTDNTYNEYFLYINQEYGSGLQLWDGIKSINDLPYRNELALNDYLNVLKLFYIREKFIPDNFLKLGKSDE